MIHIVDQVLTWRYCLNDYLQNRHLNWICRQFPLLVCFHMSALHLPVKGIINAGKWFWKERLVVWAAGVCVGRRNKITCLCFVIMGCWVWINEAPPQMKLTSEQMKSKLLVPKIREFWTLYGPKCQFYPFTINPQFNNLIERRCCDIWSIRI